MNNLRKQFCTLFKHIRNTSMLTTVNHSEALTIKPPNRSVLEPCEDDEVSHIAPYLKPTYNFAAYVNDSITLQELLKLGVNLHKLEKQRDVPEFILGLNFENNIKKHVVFLHDLGVSIEDIGELITRNPFIFKESLDDLQVRINYLQSKRFTPEMIATIICKNYFWLSFSTRDIDSKLGFIQKSFSLTGDEVRALTVQQPKLITYNQGYIKKSIFTIKEQMGLSPEECKSVLLNAPKIYMKDQTKLMEVFEYLHNTMHISQEMIVQMPTILTCRLFRLKQRYEYLVSLNRIQFDPRQPCYISPKDVVSGTDADFVSNIAKTSIQAYNTFLQSM